MTVRLKLLGMPEDQLGLAAARLFGGQQAVRLGELAAAFDNLGLEPLVDFAYRLLCLAHAQQGAGDRDQLIGFDRLDQVGIGAGIERQGPLLGADQRRRGLQYDDLGKIGLDLAADVDPIAVGKADIEQHQIGGRGGDEVDRRLSERRLAHGVALARQGVRLDVASGVVVVDDEDCRFGRGAHATSAGRPRAPPIAAVNTELDSSDFETMPAARPSRRRCCASSTIEVSTTAGTSASTESRSRNW
jgi:hypothetical protein